LPPLVSDARMLEAIADVQARRGRPAPPTLPAILAASVRALCATGALDPYAAQRKEPALGPLGTRPAPSPVPIEASLLCGFRLDAPENEALVERLLELEVPEASLVRGAPGSMGPLPVRALVSGRGGTMARVLEQRGWTVLRRSGLLAALPAATIVAHHGDPEIAELALLAGRPQIVLPATADERVVGRLIEATGAGIVLGGERPQNRLGDALRRMLTIWDWRDRATFWSKRLAEELPPDPTHDIAARCAGLA
jgi:hypothetical protein